MKGDVYQKPLTALLFPLGLGHSVLVSISRKQIFRTISTAAGVKRPKGAVKPSLESVVPSFRDLTDSTDLTFSHESSLTTYSGSVILR